MLYLNKAYVLRLEASAEPAYSIHFNQPRPASPWAEALHPARLLGLLDKAKTYHALKPHYPEAFDDVVHEVFGQKTQSNDVVRLEEAWRFDAADTVVFRVRLINPTDEAIHYEPAGFAVRAGDRVYSQSLSDASGDVPPNSEATAYFAITGTPRGGRNNLAVGNDWSVLLARRQSRQAIVVEREELKTVEESTCEP